jgi:GLPGLI family protein
LEIGFIKIDVMGNFKFVFWVFVAIGVFSAKGQEMGVDDAVYRCTYQVTTVNDTVDFESYVSQDVITLDIGEKRAVFYSLQKEKYDSISKKAVEGGFFDRSVQASAPKGVNKYVIYINYPDGKITYKEEVLGKGHSYYYIEDLSYPFWTIMEERATIIGYKCQLATCTYRGRSYNAWFTMDIPLSYGPYKFGGLPGLVVKIEDSKGHYVFEAIGFEKLTTAVSINYSVASFKQIALKDFLKIKIDYLNDTFGWINQNTGIKITPAHDSPGDTKLKEYRCLPIELNQ